MLSRPGAAVADRAPPARRARSIVFTNGVFDLLHPGHVRYLQHARALGDVLIVGLNADASVRRNKGPRGRSIRSSERAEVARGARLRRCGRAVRRGHAGGDHPSLSAGHPGQGGGLAGRPDRRPRHGRGARRTGRPDPGRAGLLDEGACRAISPLESDASTQRVALRLDVVRRRSRSISVHPADVDLLPTLQFPHASRAS